MHTVRFYYGSGRELLWLKQASWIRVGGSRLLLPGKINPPY
ncbi:MAG: hypothetical protein V9F01_12865 [Chitinophagaceae bacterium]